MRFSRIERVELYRAKEDVLNFFWDIQHLSACLSRMQVVKVVPYSHREGWFLGRGSLGGTRWTGAFQYRMTPEGLESRMTSGPEGMRAVIRIRVKQRRGGRTEVLHTEEYELPGQDGLTRLPAEAGSLRSAG